MRYTKLTSLVHRRRFDPSRKEDLNELKYFISHSKWKSGCPFYLEDPWSDIPIMCKEKYTQHMLGVK